MKFLLDLDGTLLDNNKPNLDAVTFMEEISRRNIEFLIMTNSIKSPLAIMERLRTAGIHVKVENIMNPITAINCHLEANGYINALIVGSPSEIEQVKASQNLIDPEVLVLLDFEKIDFAYEELQNLFRFMQNGVPALAASGSPYYLKNGMKQLDTGSFVTLLETAAGCKIKILGKPSQEYFLAGIASLNVEVIDAIVVGDDWSTDILGSASAGCKSILVRSGKYQPGEELNCNPTRVVSRLMDIFES